MNEANNFLIDYNYFKINGSRFLAIKCAVSQNNKKKKKNASVFNLFLHLTYLSYYINVQISGKHSVCYRTRLN